MKKKHILKEFQDICSNVVFIQKMSIASQIIYPTALRPTWACRQSPLLSATTRPAMVSWPCSPMSTSCLGEEGGVERRIEGAETLGSRREFN